MPAAIGPRFVLEAGFLILLAVVVGLAELSSALIVLVMAVGWLLVALIEYFAWRQTAGFPTVQTATVEAAPPASVQQEVVEDVAPAPSPPPTPPPAEEETIVVPPAEETPPTEAEKPLDFKPERLITYSLEPLQPRPSRRWIIFGPRVRREGDSEKEQ